MNFKILLTALVLSACPTLAQAAPNQCSAGPCADGSSCSVSGSTYAKCSCAVPFHWPWEDAKPATASCTSGRVIAPGGTLPADVDVEQYDAHHLPSEASYYLEEVPLTPPTE